VLIGTVTGRIFVSQYDFYCSTSLTGASATLAFGAVGRTDLIPAQTATELDAGEFYRETTNVAAILASGGLLTVATNLIFTVATAAITAGVIETCFMWVPMSTDGNLA
jgi:hypothetical protein